MIPIINPLAAGCLHDFYVHSGFSRWDHYTIPFLHILLDHGTHSQRDVCAQRTTSRRYLKNLARVPVIWVSGGSVLNWEQPKSGGYNTWVFPVTLMFHLHDLMIIFWNFWTDPLCSSGRSQVAVNSCSCYAAGELHFGEMCMKPGKPSTFATVKSAENQPRLFFGA